MQDWRFLLHHSIRVKLRFTEKKMKKIIWLLHRAAVMPFGEYSYRFHNFISTLVDLILLKVKKPVYCKTYLPEVKVLRKYSFSNILGKDFSDILPDKFKVTCISEANQITQNNISFFDLNNCYLGNMIDWNFDYKNKKTFQLRDPFWGFHSFKKYGDLKYVFENNKHQELVRLSEAYILTGNKLYVDKIVENIQTWIQQCPYMYSVNWSSPSEMAYRLISWTISFEMLRSHYSFFDNFLHQWAQSIYQHIRLIRKNYSKFSSAGNHLISEATGVFVASLQWRFFFKGHELSFLESAQNEAFSILLNEAETQIFPDGVNYEQAICYQVFAANQLFLALFFGRLSAVSFPERYHKRLHDCARFLSAVLNKEGTPPKFGDEDSAWAFRFCEGTSNKYLDQLSVFAVFFNDPSLIAKHPISETAYWLFGSKAIQFDALRAERMLPVNRKTKGVKESIFPHGGYYLAALNGGSEKEVLTFFDFGPLGTRSTGAHGHADALNLCLSICGEWIFIDAGTYHYKDSIERKSLRVTSAHNTLNFGNLSSQDKYWGPFLWGERHKASGYSLGPGEFKGSVTWHSGETHTREIKFSEKKLLISDSWSGKNYPAIVFTLSQDLCPFVSLGEDNVVSICDKKFKCCLKANSCLIAIEDVNVSPDFYQLAESKRIVVYPEKYIGQQTIEIDWEFN